MFKITVPYGSFAIHVGGEHPPEDLTFDVDYAGSLDDLKTDLCNNCWVKVQVTSTGEEILIKSSEINLVREVE